MLLMAEIDHFEIEFKIQYVTLYESDHVRKM